MIEYEKQAVMLHAELYGWVYRGAETVINEFPVSFETLMTWHDRLKLLSERSKRLALVCDTDEAKRAYIRCVELTEVFKREIIKNVNI